LIVTCAECATQFQLDEARVPESGIRVRCSVCKHAFFVEHPDGFGETSADPVERAVEDALGAEADVVPEATHDLDAEADASAPGLLDDAREDESWEFSDGGRLSEAATGERFEQSFEAARSAVDDLLGSPDLPPEPAPLPRRDRETAPAATREAAEEPSAGLEPALAEAPVPLADDPWEVPSWSEGAAEIEGPEAQQPLDGAGDLETGDLEIDMEEARASVPEPDPFADELADPPGFGDLEAPDAGALERPSGLDLYDGDPPALPPASSLAHPTLPASMVGEPLPLGLRAGLEPKPTSAVARWFANAGSAIGWGVVTVLAAVTLWASAAPRTAPAASPRAQSIAGFEATGIEGRWVENASAGSLYVVRGELRNPGAGPRAPAARLALRLLDARGVPLHEPVASLAPPLRAASLREADPRELRGLREAGAREMARTPVAGGASIAFEAVVEALPDAAQRFDLVVAPPEGS